jgi:integrase
MKPAKRAVANTARRHKIRAVMARPGTPGEGEAARRAIARIDSKVVPKRGSVSLNNEFVRNLDVGKSGPGTYWDSDPKASGFGCRLNAGGSKSFFVNYRIDGRERRVVIGPFPRWSAAAARERAKELRREIDRGGDPASDRRERREAPTVRDLIDRYIADHLPRKRLSAPRVNDEKRMLAEIGKHLGKHTKIADVHFGDVQAMHRKIGESIGRSGKPRQARANRILAVASKMFSLSLVPRAGELLAWRSAALGNPCRGVEKFPEEGRERFFSEKELAKISDALAKYPGVAADCVRLIMLSGCRPAEALQAKWSEFTAEPGFWVKPSSHTKQRKVHKLPLNPPGIELIERLRKKHKGEWVFPGDKPGEHLAALWHVWHFVRKETGLEKTARVYDLRHSHASIGAAEGLSLPVIGRLLGHATPRTTARYAHLADDPLREASAKIGSVIVKNGGARARP